MWRALFAFALSHGTMLPERMNVLDEARNDVPFSLHQLTVLRDDFQYPHDIEYLYKQISDPAHKHKFCAMARALAWSDGDMDAQDERILERVACLGGEDRQFLSDSRADPELHSYLEQYTQSGMLGLWQAPHIVNLRV